MNIKPIGNRIAVQRDAAEGETVRESGIVIPEIAQKRPQLATVVAVGPGLRTLEGKIVPTQMKPGDRVVLGVYAGSDVTLDNVTVTFLKEDEVLAIVGKAEPNV